MKKPFQTEDEKRKGKYSKDNFWKNISDSFEDIFDDRPEGCAACGSDTYPMCKHGCPLINED